MIKFIQQEASEKAQEIKLKADEEYNIEKLYMVEEEKQKIRQEYERKEKQVEVQKRMCASLAVMREIAASARVSRGIGWGVGAPLLPPPSGSPPLEKHAQLRLAAPSAVPSPMRSDTRD